MKPLLRDVIPEQWPVRLLGRGAASYRGRQLGHWLYRRDAMDYEAMHNLPGDLRADLAGTFDASGLQLSERLVSADGTRKLLFRLRDGQTVESVIIPMRDHATVCISSQVGCRMACRFCATAQGGLRRNLSCGEIVEQVQRLAADLRADPFEHLGERGYNVVFMGMGEPLDNAEAVMQALAVMTSSAGLGLSPQRLQISTSGPLHGLTELDKLAIPVGLTISLGSVDDACRRKLMPVPGRAGAAEVLTAAERYAKRTRQRATIAWVMIAGQTDDLDQARQLAGLARRRPFKINLIPLNTMTGSRLAAAPKDRTLAFQRVLTEAGVPAFIRASGGQDIGAACGQLRQQRMAAEQRFRTRACKDGSDTGRKQAR